MTEEILLQAKNVSKRFPGVQALDKVDFNLHGGTVHAVCGENGAGKSTLMNILIGMYKRDEGEIYLKGKLVDFAIPKHALEAGIAIIAQELNPIPDMTVAENIFLGKERTKAGIFVDYAQLKRGAREILKRLDVDIDVQRKMKDLSLAEVQLVEIAKALSSDSGIIIMDEPTSAIGEHDVENLFKVIRNLKEQNKGIIFVSHRLKEIFTIADSITVLRDGKLIATQPLEEIDRTMLVNMMIGRKMEEEYIKENTPTNNIALRVNNLTKKGYFNNISLDVREGEIFGIFGLMGAGRSEFLSTIFGDMRPDEGTIEIENLKVKIKSPKQAIKAGIAFITEDRKNSGLILTGNVRDNISLSSLKMYSDFIFLNKKREESNVKKVVKQFNVKTPSLLQPITQLSGGNQQKIVISKWILTDPKILLLDEPTRGIDVGAKREIYRLMSDFAKKGYAIIMVSSEMPEIMAMSDRIGIFRAGELVTVCNTKEIKQENLMQYASYGLAS